MSDWRQVYLAALKAAQQSTANITELVQAYSTLADRYAAQAVATPADNNGGGDSLAEALRARNATLARLRVADDLLARLRTRTAADARALRAAAAERQLLTIKLADRDHELREKGKLVENVQDEMIMLNLQLSMVETQRDKIKLENGELVARLGQRAAGVADLSNRPHELGTRPA